MSDTRDTCDTLEAKAQPIVALLYDFDKTLCTKDMQEYKFIPELEMQASDFWNEATELAENNKMDKILAYMYLMLKRARDRNIPIKRENFVALGKDLELFPGVVDWFKRINDFGKAKNVQIEHYIISSGLREIIEGSQIFKFFREVFACEYYYDVNGVAVWPKNAVNYTAKTQFLFRINKGVLDLSNDNDLNRYTPEVRRRVPFTNMVYIGDGLTDVPCMRLVKSNGGFSIAVYQAKQKMDTVDALLQYGRVNFILPADYSKGSRLESTVKEIVEQIALSARLREANLQQKEALSAKKPL